MQELGQRLCQLVMQFSFFDFYQIYGKMLKVEIRPKLTPNEKHLRRWGTRVPSADSL